MLSAARRIENRIDQQDANDESIENHYGCLNTQEVSFARNMMVSLFTSTLVWAILQNEIADLHFFYVNKFMQQGLENMLSAARTIARHTQEVEV